VWVRTKAVVKQQTQTLKSFVSRQASLRRRKDTETRPVEEQRPTLQDAQEKPIKGSEGRALGGVEMEADDARDVVDPAYAAESGATVKLEKLVGGDMLTLKTGRAKMKNVIRLNKFVQGAEGTSINHDLSPPTALTLPAASILDAVGSTRNKKTKGKSKAVMALLSSPYGMPAQAKTKGPSKVLAPGPPLMPGLPLAPDSLLRNGPSTALAQASRSVMQLQRVAAPKTTISPSRPREWK
jgi:hypothetical protein